MPLSPNVSEQTTRFLTGLTPGTWPPSAYYVSLHTSNPGTTGAGEVVGGSYGRQVVGWEWDAVDARAENDAQIEFTDMPSSTIAFVGVWDNVTGGNFLFGGTLTASKTLTAGDSVRFAVNNLTVKVV